LINKDTVTVSGQAVNAAGAYNPTECRMKFYWTTMHPSETIPHELKHMQESLFRTAAYHADPKEYQRVIIDQWLMDVGTNTGRRNLQSYERRPLLSDIAKHQLETLLRSSLHEINIDPQAADHVNLIDETSKWLNTKEIPTELSQELATQKTSLPREMAAEMRHLESMLMGATISDTTIEKNAELNKFIEAYANRFRKWKEQNHKPLSENPEYIKLMRDLTINAVAKVNLSEYGFSPEELAANRFEETRKIANILAWKDTGPKHAGLPGKEEKPFHWKSGKVERELPGKLWAKLRIAQTDLAYNVTRQRIMTEYNKAKLSTENDIKQKHLLEAKMQALKLLGMGQSVRTKPGQKVAKYLYDLGLVSDEELAKRGLKKNEAGRVMFPLVN
jgi:hypothetical protein